MVGFGVSPILSNNPDFRISYVMCRFLSFRKDSPKNLLLIQRSRPTLISLSSEGEREKEGYTFPPRQQNLAEFTLLHLLLLRSSFPHRTRTRRGLRFLVQGTQCLLDVRKARTRQGARLIRRGKPTYLYTLPMTKVSIHQSLYPVSTFIS